MSLVRSLFLAGLLSLADAVPLSKLSPGSQTRDTVTKDSTVTLAETTAAAPGNGYGYDGDPSLYTSLTAYDQCERYYARASGTYGSVELYMYGGYGWPFKTPLTSLTESVAVYSGGVLQSEGKLLITDLPMTQVAARMYVVPLSKPVTLTQGSMYNLSSVFPGNNGSGDVIYMSAAKPINQDIHSTYFTYPPNGQHYAATSLPWPTTEAGLPQQTVQENRPFYFNFKDGQATTGGGGTCPTQPQPSNGYGFRNELSGPGSAYDQCQSYTAVATGSYNTVEVKLYGGYGWPFSSPLTQLTHSVAIFGNGYLLAWGSLAIYYLPTTLAGAKTYQVRLAGQVAINQGSTYTLCVSSGYPNFQTQGDVISVGAANDVAGVSTTYMTFPQYNGGHYGGITNWPATESSLPPRTALGKRPFYFSFQNTC